MTENEQEEEPLADLFEVAGTIKWFDPVKGFGFIVPNNAEADVLLHINVLRKYGQNTIADGAGIEVRAQYNKRGLQAVEVLSITAPVDVETNSLPDFIEADASLLENIMLEPARVKWFDKGKGFGFANIFGKPEDVFLHVEVLRGAGLSDVQVGEALAIKVIEGERGKMAAKVQAWETAKTDQD